MSVQNLGYAEPFFPVVYIEDELEYLIEGKSIVLNLAPEPLFVKAQGLGFFKSTICCRIGIRRAKRCLVIGNFEQPWDQETLFEAIKKKWTLVYDATGLARHKDVQLWRSRKEKLGDVEVNMCYADTIPLNVGLHRTHWGDQPFKEVHTQILGYGKMQQYSEQDPGTLYREDAMAPGCTHEPMYDHDCLYPWHQYETITRAIFQATEMQFSRHQEEETAGYHPLRRE